MQMYAAERYGAAEAFRFDRYTVTMTHADALIALLSGSNQINAHFTSPPFHQREIKDPRVRTRARHRRHHGRRDDVHDAVDDGAVPRGESRRLRGGPRRARGSQRADPQRPARGGARSCSPRNRRPAFRSRSSSRCCATPTFASRRRPRTPRSTPSSCKRSARSRIGRARGAICSFPKIHGAGRLLIRDAERHEAHDRA